MTAVYKTDIWHIEPTKTGRLFKNIYLIEECRLLVQSTTSTRRHTPEDGILQSHRRENLKSYIYLIA
jgi:hypothetical protein